MLPVLKNSIEKAVEMNIQVERIGVLQLLVDYIQSKIDQKKEVNLNFICTHNSRRSQFSQIWAHTAANYFGIPANCYSGGVEKTAFNRRAVESIKRSGFKVETNRGANPHYSVFLSEDHDPILAFSKLFDDPINNSDLFAAVMTCSHADENCPLIPGAEKRIPVRYEDPKSFDDTPEESVIYDQRSMQIASEMFYIFSKVKIPK